MRKSYNHEFAKVPFLSLSLQERRKNIERCLRSVNWVNEAFVADSQSTDRTIAWRSRRSEGSAVQLPGRLAKKKNWARQLAFQKRVGSHPRCRRMPASEAEEEIRKIIEIRSTHSSYWINRRYFMANRSSTPTAIGIATLQASTREIRKDHGGDTDSGDREIHEHVVVRARPASSRQSWITTPFQRLKVSLKNTTGTRIGKQL